VVRVERIETAGRDARARRIVFTDGQESRLTSSAVVKALSLSEGDEVEPDALMAELAELEPLQARERALRLVGYRERSRHELSTRLLDDGYPAAIVQPLVERFVDYAFVDDSRFAAAFVRARVNAGYGRRKIERELADKGIERDAVDAAFADSEVGEELTRALAMIGSRAVSTRAEREKVVRRLVTRGFDVKTAYLAVDEANRAAGDDAPFVG